MADRRLIMATPVSASRSLHMLGVLLCFAAGVWMERRKAPTNSWPPDSLQFCSPREWDRSPYRPLDQPHFAEGERRCVSYLREKKL